MLSELCAELNNYFVKDIHHGTFTISGGVLGPLDFLQNGQYFRIVGSVFNDGVYQYGAEGIAFLDETFDGSIWSMAVPPDFIALAHEIEKWQQSDAAKPSAYTSESFGGYSYTRATNSQGMAVTWKDAFSSRLNKWRKLGISNARPNPHMTPPLPHKDNPWR